MGFYILKGSARLVSDNNAIVARPVIMLLAMLCRGARQARKCREKLGESLYESKKSGSGVLLYEKYFVFLKCRDKPQTLLNKLLEQLIIVVSRH